MSTLKAAAPSRNTPLPPETARICMESGISLLKDKLITLKELEKGLKLSIKQAEAAEKSEDFWGRALVAARFTSATCDVIIDVMAEWVPGKGASVIKKIYDQKDIIADATIGKADIYKIGKKSITEGAGILAKKGKITKETEISTKEISKRADLVRDGLTGDLKSDKIRKYITDGHFDIAEKVMKEIKGEVGGKAVRTGKSIFNYTFEVIKIVNDRKSETENGSGIASAKKALLSTLRRIQQKIGDLETEIQACNMPELDIRLGFANTSSVGHV